MGKGSTRHTRQEYAALVAAMPREDLEREARRIQIRLTNERRRANAANKEAALKRAELKGERFEHSRTLLRYERLTAAGPRALAYAQHQIALIREIVDPNQRIDAWSEFLSTVKEEG